jgi:hypothetical protein
LFSKSRSTARRGAGYTSEDMKSTPRMAAGAATPPAAPSVALLLVLLLPLLAACGGNTAESARPTRPLPSYAAHWLDLFDDAIEPMAVGGFQLAPSAAGRAAPRSDNLLRERTQVGDAVVRARVTTLTSKEEDRGRSWQLGLQTLERLGGAGPLEEDFVLRVGPGDAAGGIVRAFETRLIGQTFIAFVREFGRPGGDSELHFHIAPDTRDEVDAVTAAVMLR